MSQITVENIKRPTETASRSTRGVAAAWINFFGGDNGGSSVFIRDSQNVSSLTDGGVGVYSYTVSSSFANTNFSCQGTAHAVAEAWMFSPKTIADSVSQARFDLANSSIVSDDASNCDGTIHGDLA